MAEDNDPTPPIETVLDRDRAFDHPESIGRYHIIEPIGEGGMGNVYKAEQRTPVRRIVALKVIKLGMDTKEVFARFEGERQALAMMDHPNIARVLDAGATDTGRPYFVMEYVPGEPLTDYCDKHQLTTRLRLKLFICVCDAVQHAHQKGIIHRDLKPSNILVSVREGQPVPKVIDFGVAKATSQKLTERTLFTETGRLIGTPEYMSPEQAEMSALDVDTRSDVYSLGVVLYELLTGTLPFDTKALRSAAFNEIQRMIREVDPPRPSTRLSTLDVQLATEIARHRSSAPESLRAELKSELEWIPLKAMRKDRTQRYRSASEMADDINNYLSQRPLMAAPESPAYRMRKFLVRHKGAVAAATAVLLTLLLGIAGTTIALIGQSRQRAIAQSQRAMAEHEAAKQRAVNVFLQEMLGAADARNLTASDRAKGRNVTVLDALNEAARKVDSGSLKSEADVEWSARYTIAQTYRGIGELVPAERQAQAALRLVREMHGAQPHADVASCIDLLATISQDKGQLPEAEKMHREALELRRRLFGDDHRDVAESMNNLAIVLQMQGRLADAEALYRQSVQVLRKQQSPDDGRIATTLSNLGLLLRASGMLADSEQMQREALELRRKALGGEHPDIAMSLGNLGLVLHDAGKLDQAEPLLRDALLMYRKLLGDEHPDVAAAINNLASVLKDRQKFAESAAMYREGIVILRKHHGNEHPSIATMTNNLAMVVEAQGTLAEAEQLHRETLAMRRKLLGDEHPDVAMSLNNLGLVLSAEKKFQEAEALFRQALTINRKLLGEEHPTVATNLNNLAGALRDQGNLAGAEPLFRESLTQLKKLLGENHPYIAASSGNLAVVLLRQGKAAEAEPFQRDALRIREQTMPGGDPRIASAAQVLGAILTQESKYADAEPLLLRAHDALVAAAGVPVEVRRRSIVELITLYEAWQKTDQSAQRRQELATFDSKNPTTSSTNAATAN